MMSAITPADLRRATIWALVLASVMIPVSAMSQNANPGENLTQQWLDVQVHGSQQVRRSFWEGLTPNQLNAYIEAGAELSIADKRGWTPLHSAARYNSNSAIVKVLLEAGATVDTKDRSGDTPLHWAAAENTNTEVIKALLNAGAEVNARDKYGWLPIHTAADNNPNPDVVDTLLAAGAKRNKWAYFVLFRPVFLLKHNANMSDKDKEMALALLRDTE